MHDLDPDMDLTDPNPTTPLPSTPRLIGRFRVDRLLGRGGMGEVHKAYDSTNKRDVAIKILDTRGYEDHDTLKRFEREAMAALVLDHPNIGRFYGTERDNEDRPIIVMEFIEGEGLDMLLQNTPDLSFSQRLDFVIQAAKGLEYAYRRSIIHRDVKPGNLLVDSSGRLKIIDFGLAKSLWDNSNLTGTGLVVGTPRYISPEQGMGRSVDHRSDIYSLGATFYEMVTGKTPFDGDTPLAIMMKHINAPLTPPYLVNPRVPNDMSDIIMKMMAKDPGHRYQDYEPLVRDLESAKIHRMAKERRTPGNASGLQTVVLPENLADYTDEYKAATSYLTEGLIDVEVPVAEEERTSPAKFILLSIAGMVVLGCALMLLLKPGASDSDGEVSSSLGKKIGALFAKNRGKAPETPTVTDIARRDEEFIRTTRARMDAVVSKLLTLGRHRDFSTVAALRTEGLFTEEQTTDAWGNDFYISDGSGGGVLVAPGRDGADNTADDFRMWLDGSQQTIPEPLHPPEPAK